MFKTRECNECIHEKICNFKTEYNNMFNALFYETYPVGPGEHKKIGDSEIIVCLECPHFIRKEGADNG